MKLDEFRLEMESFRRAVDKEGTLLKDSGYASKRLRSLYQQFDKDKQAMADQVLTEWVSSEDEGVRFDALALIEDFKIAKSVPALRVLAARLAFDSVPGAPYEIQRIDRILRALTFRSE